MGSWEIKQNNQVLVGILHTDQVSVAWSLGLRNLIVPGVIMPVSGMPYDMARNTICRAALEGGFEWCFHFDSDVVAPRDAILRLLAHRLPVVSGMYCRRSPPHGVPVMIKNGSWVTQFVPGSMVEVDLVGAGCLLIHRSVLEKLPPSRPEAGKHWFDWKVDCAGIVPQGEALSEDFVFCKNVREKLGLKIWVDTGVACKHVGLAEATYGNLQPCQANPNT